MAAKTPNTSIVLGSGSPRRKALLEAAGLSINIRPPQLVEERIDPNLDLEVGLEKLLQEKLASVAHSVGETVLCADTVVVVDGEPWGKPADRDDAARMLRGLSGNAHEVWTAILIARGDARSYRIVKTKVQFRELSDDEVEGYLATGEPFDKAGAYAIQGDGGALVDRLEGSYTNVIGLPLAETLSLLREVQDA